ncbi:MAG TPA: SDR family oxidoreductase [Myxococcota bacterium]|nr:SDR family oxidoreductase [Myxococcota bacterium]
MSRPLEGKRAFVTGGSRGIGAGIVRRLARDGAHVAFTYVSKPEHAAETAAAARAHGVEVLALEADSADAAALARAIDDAAKRWSGLDVLVSSAGLMTMAPIDAYRLEDFDRMLAVNVRAAFVAIHAALPYMSRGARIVTIGSCNADRMPFTGGSVYALTKSALVGFVKGVARDLGPRGITINNVQPGPIDTDGNPADGPFAETLKGLMAVGRYASADEVAGLVAYLAGPESAFVTGASLSIDGGFTA